jgi:hypothetical protein
MGKIIRYFFLLSLFIFLASSPSRAEPFKTKVTERYTADINKDGKKELLVHDDFGGSAGFGELRIYNYKGICLFDRKVEGDAYLWHPVKHIPALNPDYFPDLDKDGIVEIVVGHRGTEDRFAQVDQPWWFDIYKWNGKKYVLADDQFPEYYKEELSDYKSFVKEKGNSALIREYINRAANFAGLKEQEE